MNVTLLGHTQLALPVHCKFQGDLDFGHISEGQVIALAAIRQCYSHKTALEVLETESAKYFGDKGKEGKRLFDHIMKSKHTSTMEHIHFTFAVEGVSRALLAQLTRHRQLSFSVQSQRYTKAFKDESIERREREKKYSNIKKRTPFNKLTIGEEHKLMDLYDDGLSTFEIGKVFGVNAQTVSNIMKHYEKKMRGNNESVVNHNFFEKIDTPNKAHLLGWVVSDGYISESERNGYTFKTLGIKVQKIDKQILKQIKKIINAKNGYQELKNENAATFRVSSPKIYDDLFSKGITPAKSLTVEAVKIFEEVPSYLWGDLFLGIFEGDGSFGVYKYMEKLSGKERIKYMLTISSGSEPFLNQLRKYVNDSCGIESGRIKEVKSGTFDSLTYQLVWQSKDDIEKIALWMYENVDFDFVLERKAKNFFDNYESVMNLFLSKLNALSEDHNFVVPKNIEKNFDAILVIRDYLEKTKESYIELYSKGVPQEDCRSILGNGYKTNLITSGNLRAWLEFYKKRKKGEGAQAEICEFAEHIKNAIIEVEPWVSDYFDLT